MSEQKVKPIIFQGDMVRALLEGRKTQTRRVVKPQPPEYCNSALVDKGMVQFGWGEECTDQGVIDCPYGQPGDLLWVREAFARRRLREIFTGQPAQETVYRAGKLVKKGEDAPPDFDFDKWPTAWSDEDLTEGERWRPSIHMPRKLSRLTLRLTAVRVERVQEIDPRGVDAEGFEPEPVCCERPDMTAMGPVCCGSPEPDMGQALGSFIDTWDSINAAKGYDWDANPWVWVLEFEVIHANVDDVLRQEAK